MLILGLILNMLGLGLFCWLIFTLTIFALPFFIALSVVRDAIHGGAGISAAVVVAILAGMLTLVIGQIAIAFPRSAHLRAMIAAEFAVPAAVAGYHVVHVYRKLGCPHCYGGTPLPGAAAIAVGTTAWTRMVIFAKPPQPVEAFTNGPRPTCTATR